MSANASTYALHPTTVVARGISTGGYYALRVAHTHAERLFAVVAQGGGSHHMFDAEWIGAQNQMEYPFALAYKFDFRDADVAASVRLHAEGAHAFSLLEFGIVDSPSCRLLALNGMEDSIFPIEDNFIVATRGVGKDLLARGNLSHMGNPAARISSSPGLTKRWQAAAPSAVSRPILIRRREGEFLRAPVRGTWRESCSASQRLARTRVGPMKRFKRRP